MSDAHPSDWRETAPRPTAGPRRRYRFPAWSNRAAPIALGTLLAATGLTVFAYAYYADDRHLSVGYRPEQPIEFSHKQHAGDLGLDCRHCHSTAEETGFAAVPAAQVCFSCHTKILPDSIKLLRLWESVTKGKPVAWIRVHKLPEHAHFDHSAHLSAGIGCSTCHGRIDQMPVVEQKEPLSMGWCLDCHRNPAPYVRPHRDLTNMSWTEAHAVSPPRPLDPPQHCSGCHQ